MKVKTETAEEAKKLIDLLNSKGIESYRDFSKPDRDQFKEVFIDAYSKNGVPNSYPDPIDYMRGYKINIKDFLRDCSEWWKDFSTVPKKTEGCPHLCPICKSSGMPKTDIDNDDPNSLHINWMCCDCGFEWVESYWFIT